MKEESPFTMLIWLWFKKYHTVHQGFVNGMLSIY